MFSLESLNCPKMDLADSEPVCSALEAQSQQIHHHKKISLLCKELKELHSCQDSLKEAFVALLNFLGELMQKMQNQPDFNIQTDTPVASSPLPLPLHLITARMLLWRFR